MAKVVIQQSVGGRPVTGGATGAFMTMPGTSSYSAVNAVPDVWKIQELLHVLAVPRRPLALNGRCGPELVESIVAFQRLWPGIADGQVDPNGLTLKRMNRVAEPLEPSEPKKQHPQKGAYLISYVGQAPPQPYRVLLNLTPATPPALVPGQPLGLEASHCMDVTTRPSGDLLSKDNLPEFLDLVAKRDLWGDTKAAIRLVVVRNDQVVSVSSHRVFNAPVRPWSREVSLKAFAVSDGEPKLKYIGTGEAPYIGRYLYSTRIGGKYYWKYGSELVTENQHRGFDCITFVGSVHLIDPVEGPSNPYANSQNMANAIGASAVQWTNAAGTAQVINGVANGAVIKKFFAEAAHTGKYLLWKGSHITVVLNKVVHEFGHTAGGYKETPVESWVGDTVSYHLYSHSG